MKETRDILCLFESLNSHEVFTPPKVARDMLDPLPGEVWKNPNYKFLDPCTKSGVFLREIYFRLFESLRGMGPHKAHDGKTYNLDIDQERSNHILKNMVYGIATSELTGYVSRRTLYGVMHANSDKQVEAINSLERSPEFKNWTDEEFQDFIKRNTFNEYYNHRLFDEEDYRGFELEGNIFYPSGQVRKKTSEIGSGFEDRYYPFIEGDVEHKKICLIKEGKMKFDVIVGNPPYQINDGGGRGSNAKPIYHNFVEKAISLMPNYVSFIIPSRWMQGGRGLDLFRNKFLNDQRIKKIYDFNDSKKCFPSVEIEGGVCYFLWDLSHNGSCEFTQVNKKERYVSQRKLNEHDIFIRDRLGALITKKISYISDGYFNECVYPYWPFAFAHEKAFDDFTIKKDKDHDLRFIGNKHSGKLKNSDGVGFISSDKIKRNVHLIHKHKVVVSKANGGALKSRRIISEPIYLEPNTVCTETYLVVGDFDTKEEALNLISYLKTKFFRYLLYLRKISQNTTQDTFSFIPIVPLDRHWVDKDLYERFNLSCQEIDHIENQIKEMG